MHGSTNNLSPTAPHTPSKEAFISVEAVSKSFGSLTAVADASFSLRKAEILGVLGSDGAGKTTLLRMIAAMTRPSTGIIIIDGLDVVTKRAEVKKLLGYMPQRFGLYQDLTVSENVDFFMDIYGIWGDERTRRKNVYLGFSNLLPFTDRPAGDLSGGMKQKLGLACVLVHQPSVLILDEPTNGVDPVSRQEFWSILGKMKTEGMTILVSTAYMDEGEKCDRLILMHDSRILDFSTPHKLQGHFINLEEAIIHRIEKADRTLVDDRFKT